MMANMRYPGGKNQVFRTLINLMPPHRTYIEAFLGSGAVLRYKLPAENSIGIDLDKRALKAAERWTNSNTQLVHADAIGFLSSYTYSGEELVFCDPPYLPSTRRRERIYRYELQEKDHERLLATLSSLPCMVMVSGYPSRLYESLLPQWRCEEISVSSHIGPRAEVVWMNFEVPEVLHDVNYFGSSFREREKTQRRHLRLIDKIERLSPSERSLLWRVVGKRYQNEIALADRLTSSANPSEPQHLQPKHVARRRVAA